MAAALALTAALALSGCSFMNPLTYAHAEQYSVGNAELAETIEAVEIDWSSGSVHVLTHAENTFLLTEKTGSGISDDLRMHWWLDGTTLRVRFAKSGTNLWLFHEGHKDLTLTVPESVSLREIVIRSASAEISAENLTAETLGVSTVSGDMSIGCAANAVRLNSASGDIALTQSGESGEIGIETASGKIQAELSRAGRVELKSASGKIGLSAALVDALAVKSTSGAVSCGLEAAPSECTLRAVSGSIALILPDAPDFTARIRTTSGDFESEFAMKKEGNRYISGSGSGSGNFDIETTSGDISIRKR